MIRANSQHFFAPLLALALAALLAPAAFAQQSERFGPYELHHSVVNTTFLSPEVAAEYNIVRGKKRGIVNLAIREHLADGTAVNRAALLKGRSWDLIQGQALEFQEIREGQAVYYIAPFKFINREWRHFEVHFRPEGAEQTYTFKFKHQLYVH
ncbi:DUF4426 domain-containing protein [Parahaliea aestuarii]|uniref:DUF4426 domain-containing protein n=1 Tax=Parahaliea aestuarii TaxID=1852021 RepID=A0A5C8ZYD0_9GAMM|nr:DUF4426 domain-containing protein [Parahaliea aestuarii]TXS92261.1 DUF4426 domain-containing protein [Parahaliea aestuarii]